MTFAPSDQDKSAQHIRRVYEAYGFAMYQAQCLEKQLAMVLSIHDRPKKKISRNEFEGRLVKHFSKTFGSVFSSMRKQVHFGENLESRLQKAVQKRNWLAHDYFWDRAGHFPSYDGRSLMLVELGAMAKEFDALDQELTTAFATWAERNGVTQEQLDQALDQLINKARFD